MKREILTNLVGLFGQGIDPSRFLHLYKTTQCRTISYLEWDSNPWHSVRAVEVSVRRKTCGQL